MEQRAKEPYFYVENWNEFRKYCEQRAKNSDCHINNKGWHKLKEFHLENYLKNLQSPFGFLFKIKFRYPEIFNSVKCMSRYYYKYARLRQKELATNSQRVVTYPTWRNKNVKKNNNIL
jgi:hypothetical protein